MSEPHVISALCAKRAELDGELRQAERRINQLRADLESVDGAISVFDPSLESRAIPPKLKRSRRRISATANSAERFSIRSGAPKRL